MLSYKSLFYSGGLTVRAILETMDDHNADSFIALSTPQMGQYGGKMGHYQSGGVNKIMFPDQWIWS